MLWITLALIISFLKALWELAGKVITTGSHNTQELDEYTLAFGVRAITVIPFFILCLFAGFQWQFSWETWGLIIGWALGNAITTITALKAVKYGDLSIVGPLGSLTIPFLLVTGFFITRELPNSYGLLWVLLICIGTYFLGFQAQRGNILTPLQQIFTDRGALYMLLTTVIWSITAPIDKLWVTQIGTLHWLLYLNLICSLMLAGYFVFSGKTLQLSQLTELKHIKKVWAVTLLLGLGNVLQLIAIQYTLVIYVVAIKRASGIFSVLLGSFFYQEKNIGWKLFATGIMIAGVVIITLGGNI